MGFNATEYVVSELESRGLLRVEDGNHGEYRPRRNEFDDEDGVALFIRATDMNNGQLLFNSASKINQTARNRIRKGIGKPGDVIFSHKGTVGKFAFVPLDAPAFVCSPQTTFWRTLDEKFLSRRYLYYYLKSRHFWTQIYARKGQTDMADYVSLTDQRGLKIVVPSIKKQNEIVRKIGTLDDKIDLNRRMNRTLESMARALFKSWFVDFDPVRAKQRGEAPVGVDAQTAALFPERLVDSELGEIPEGWGHGKIGDVSKVYGGSTPKTKIPKYWDDPKHYWATPKDLSGQEMPILLDTIRKLSDAGLENVTNGQRPAGTLLMSKRAPIGYLALARVPTAINQGFVALEPKGHVSNYFMLNWLHFNMELVKSRANGSTFKEISQTAFRNLPMVIPPKTVVERYDALVDAFYVKIEANLRESQTLGEMRDVLLPELLGGK